jgi:hypothetical protein
VSDQADDSDGADHGEEQDDGDRAQYRPWNAAAVFQQRRATPVRRCRSGVMDRYTDIDHVYLDGDDDDGVEFRSEDEAGYSNGRDSDGVELRSEDEAEEDDDASFIDDSLVDDTSACATCERGQFEAAMHSSLFTVNALERAVQNKGP